MPAAPAGARSRPPASIPTASLARLAAELAATGTPVDLDAATVGPVGGPGPTDLAVSGIAFDSRAVTAGSLFVCLRGARHDGHDHAAAAVAGGARALVVERRLPLRVPQLLVPDARAAMARLAAAFHRHPSRRLAVVGVTGTNGKTTVTHLLAAVMRAAGRPVEVIGTLSQARTTPEAPQLQGQLAAVADAGGQVVAMEVSSHALDQRRVDGTWFAVAAFTNLTPEHLDYHGTMERYFAAKAGLFDPARAGMGVVSIDGEYGRRLAAQAEAAGLRVRPVAMAEAGAVRHGRAGSSFTWAGHPVALGLGGDHNVANALVAGAAAQELGVGADVVARGLSAAPGVPGRFERVDAGQPFTVVVDYAHTPVALEQALRAARHLAREGGGRVAVVFGCGGDRDRLKRPAMGDIAARLADLAVVTSDNPRSEDPMAIIDEVRSGPGGKALVVEPDRRAAIVAALEQAGPGDVVVVAGKGHETTQVAGGRVTPFDDRAVVAAELARLSR